MSPTADLKRPRGRVVQEDHVHRSRAIPLNVPVVTLPVWLSRMPKTSDADGVKVVGMPIDRTVPVIVTEPVPRTVRRP